MRSFQRIEEIDAVRPETLQAPVHHSLDVIGPAVQTALVGEVEAEFVAILTSLRNGSSAPPTMVSLM